MSKRSEGLEALAGWKSGQKAKAPNDLPQPPKHAIGNTPSSDSELFRSLYQEAFMEALAQGHEPDAIRRGFKQAVLDSRFGEGVDGEGALYWKGDDTNSQRNR